MTKKINHKILLYRLRTKKDPEAFAALYDFYVKQIYRFVFFKVSNHEQAEDITSEVFLKAWHYINEGNEVESLRGLLYRLARNSVIDLYRVRARHSEVSLETVEKRLELSDGGQSYQVLNDTLESTKIIETLQKLKQEYREVVTLRYVDDLKISEIAQITGKRAINVRVTLHRALKKLKELTKDKVD